MLVFLIGCASEELTSARLYLQQENWDQAETYLLKAMEVEPENPEIPFLLGDQIYARKKDWNKMNEMFDKSLSLGADQTISVGNQTGTVADMVNIAKEQHWVAIYNQGVEFYNQARKIGVGENSPELQNAITAFRTATKVNPKNALAYDILSNCILASGDTDGALDVAVEGSSKDPKNFDINMTAGKIYSATGDKESALIYYKKAVDINPEDSKARRQLAQTYYDIGDKEMSLSTYEIAIANETDVNVKADLYYNLGVLNMQLDDFHAAEDNFSMAYDLNPDDIDALRGIAQTFESAGEWSRAEYYYRRLVDLEPENPQHYRAMARVLLHQGDTEEAQEYFDKSKEM